MNRQFRLISLEFKGKVQTRCVTWKLVVKHGEEMEKYMLQARQFAPVW